MRVDLADTACYGTTSVPGKYAQELVDDHSCRRCGSSLAGRRERVRWRGTRGLRLEVEVFRCKCGRRREVRREVTR